MKKNISRILLVAIVLLAFVLRFYKLTQNPPAISWDEAAVGYNAWAIARYGRDEWGKVLPLVFRSFGDYKNPVHFYLTAPFVGILGLNEFATRASAATFGVLNVLMIYFLGKELFENKYVGIAASLFLAVSPYNIQFSRFNHELNFAVFFFMLGLWLFLKALKQTPKLLLFSFFSFGICLISYHSAKVVVPPVVILLIVLYLKKLIGLRKYFIPSLLILAGFICLIVLIKPELMGMARLKQTSSGLAEASIQEKVKIVSNKYREYVSNEFLFESGDPNPRHSTQTVGVFYRIDAPLLVAGLSGIFYGLLKKKKEGLILLAWAFLAPLPATAGVEKAHAARAMFMTGSWHLISALGLVTMVNLLSHKFVKAGLVILVLAILAFYVRNYLFDYFVNYPKKYAIEWQYGMQEIAQYVKKTSSYMTVYMTDAFMQPYIFYLFYLKTPLPEFLTTVKYNETESRPSNLVASYDRYRFGLWDEIESIPSRSLLYVVNPSKYDGLRYKHEFEVVKKIEYPDGTDAFFLVLGKNL